VFDQTTIDEKRLVNRITRDGSDFNAVLLAIAAHDMRQPLQAVLSCYDRLADRHNDERERNYLEHGKQAIKRLIEQLDRLIEALRIHERGADAEPGLVDVQTIFANLQRDSMETAAQKGVELRVVRTAATVVSDAILLESILSNLVRNALKYTPAGGRVLVGCRRQESLIRIGVYDTGVGIPSHNTAQIFEAFRRLDSNTSDGLGLGLFVVRRAAELLGHKVEVRSKVGCGSSFAVLADASPKGVRKLP
jgi:two-component system, OmpR family, phosphate regulon sensor histidine kinase PhoR